MELKTIITVNEEEFHALQEFFFIMREFCKNSNCSSDCAFYTICTVSPSDWDEDDFPSCFKIEEE